MYIEDKCTPPPPLSPRCAPPWPPRGVKTHARISGRVMPCSPCCSSNSTACLPASNASLPTGRPAPCRRPHRRVHPAPCSAQPAILPQAALPGTSPGQSPRVFPWPHHVRTHPLPNPDPCLRNHPVPRKHRRSAVASRNRAHPSATTAPTRPALGCQAIFHGLPRPHPRMPILL